MSPPGHRRRALQVLWNLRALGLFLIGPVIGVWIVAAVFGMPRSLVIAAGIMFLFPLAMCATLARGEWRRLSSGR